MTTLCPGLRVESGIMGLKLPEASCNPMERGFLWEIEIQSQ
jgi:hypothetical protein